MQSPLNADNGIMVRLEAVKAAARVSSPYDGIGNLLIHAQWLANYVLTGTPPEVEASRSGA